MTDEQFEAEYKWIDAEMKTWGKAPRNLADRTPWQVAVVERWDHFINWILGNRPEPPPFDEWRKTLPPRTLYRHGGED